jgi:type I restriction enzyme, S subunit
VNVPMRESGVEFLGAVPAHWDVQPAVTLARVLTSTVDKKSYEGEQSVKLCNYTDVYYSDQIVDSSDFMVATATSEQIAKFSVRAGDVPFTKDSETADDIGIPSYVPKDLPGTVYGYHLCIFRPNDKRRGRFLKYLLESDYARAYFEAKTPGVTRVGLGQVTIRYFGAPTPPVEEAVAIADYLDRETAQIDAFIAKNEELIALLAERLGAVVDGVMAELGLAEPDDLAISREYPLPESWRIISLGSLLLQLTNGYVGPTRDILVDDGIRYIQGTHVKKGKIDFLRRPFFVTRKWHDERPRIHLREGDVLIVQTGDIGKVAVVPPGFGEASCHALQIARVNRRIIDPQFLGAYLSSQFGYHQLTSRATGALHLHLEASIKSVPVVVPPLDVQAQIVREVRERESQIETAIGTAERLVALSKERRAALISAAVTGKVDVRVAA